MNNTDLYAKHDIYVIILVDTIGINCTKLNKILMKLECLDSNPLGTACYIRIHDLYNLYIIHVTREIFCLQHMSTI